MCGIAGSINGDPAIVEALLYAMEERGGDSTGVAGGMPGGRFRIKRLTQPATLAMQDPDFYDALMEGQDGVVIAHTRAATVGVIKASNAHPFHAGRIIGCHNGTIDSFHPGVPEAEVDSERLIKALAQRSPATVLGHNSTQPSIIKHGVYALAWYDKEECLLHLARAGDRPLHYAIADNGTYYCSTSLPLRIALAAQGWHGDIVALKDGEHITFNAQGNIIAKRIHPIPTRSPKYRFKAWLRKQGRRFA